MVRELVAISPARPPYPAFAHGDEPMKLNLMAYREPPMQAAPSMAASVGSTRFAEKVRDIVGLYLNVSCSALGKALPLS
jgi:hypothetical protein